MSTVVVSAARTAGSLAIKQIGSPLLRTAARYALPYATRALRNGLDDRVFEGPRLESFHVQTSRDGAPMPRVFGRARLAGQVIWASRLKENITEERQGIKGGPTQRSFQYTISFAIGLCEGEILGVNRLWANGAVLPAGPTIRVYTGSETQLPDPIITAIEGANAPAFRGTAYLVFEDFPLDDYGARLPQINAEVIRAVGDKPKLETLVTGVNLIPASGEFAYATDIVEEGGDPGAARPINMNNLTGQADITAALDQLETQLPNCKNVSIVVSWFGTSVDAGTCEIVPGVETRDRITPDVQWSVAEQTRGTAYLVSQSNGLANYGGTPSDASILQTIATLKARGMAVTIYPFILMDAPGFPWRGRIAAASAANADTFFTRAKGFRRFILHYANLAAQAGGVDRFIIGSEMRDLTTSVFDGAYPAVNQFVTLAADAAQILPNAELSYAADWSEYFGHQEGADLTYHLDPLWASPHIDGVAIDAYFPLSDWRDGDHLDAALADSPYDTAYLKSQMEGGEGYDYYYDSQADRDAQVRTPITDPVYRYKDIRSWHSSQHFNRVNGIASQTPTAWTPASKPIWFTEIGCPAIDKGANQPNVFYDPKSVESFFPYHSHGSRDDLIQRRYLEAFIEYWAEDEMIDTSATHVWCWDARPFPDFPARISVWTDGPNWNRGHWISGRTGVVPLGDIVLEICEDTGVDVDVSKLNGLVSGYTIDRPMSAAAALLPLSLVYGFNWRDHKGKISFISYELEIKSNLIVSDLLGVVERVKSDSEPRLRDARLHYIDAARDYQIGMTSARNLDAESVRLIDINAPILMDESFARRAATAMLERTLAAEHGVDFELSPVRSDVSIGDVVTLPNVDGAWQIETLGGLTSRKATARLVTQIKPLSLAGFEPVVSSSIPFVPKPFLFMVDMAGETAPLIGAVMSPFNAVTVDDVTLSVPAAMGALMTNLSAGPIGRWDYGSEIDIKIARLDLASVEASAILDGQNRFAIETDEGWAVIAARDITLIGENTYRLKTLLRDTPDIIASGARVIWLGRGLEPYPIDPARIGETLSIMGSAATRESDPLNFTYQARHLRPLPPVHGKVRMTDTHLEASWIRQTRLGGDNWAAMDVPLGEEREFYRVEIVRGEDIIAEFEVYTASLSVDLADIPALQAGDSVNLSQGSAALGYGKPSCLVI